MSKRILLILLLLCSCSSNRTSGPDKQGQGALAGMVVGAGTGAITGFHVASATGPGAAIGAGFGFVAGAVKGAMQDAMEKNIQELENQISEEKDIAQAQAMLVQHYKRKLSLHPARDIFPADWFFEPDSYQVQDYGNALIHEIARLNKNRFPYSRLVVAVYVKTIDENSDFAQALALRRGKEIGNLLVRYGIEPRRIETRAILVNTPVLVDPQDDPTRYAQAVEFIPVDR